MRLPSSAARPRSGWAAPAHGSLATPFYTDTSPEIMSLRLGLYGLSEEIFTNQGHRTLSCASYMHEHVIVTWWVLPSSKMQCNPTATLLLIANAQTSVGLWRTSWACFGTDCCRSAPELQWKWRSTCFCGGWNSAHLSGCLWNNMQKQHLAIFHSWLGDPLLSTHL